jgi:hypothetical protein
MNKIKQISTYLTTNRLFELAIVAVILINSLLIGVETYVTNPTITLIQTVILGIFTFEIALRYIAANSNK